MLKRFFIFYFIYKVEQFLNVQSFKFNVILEWAFRQVNIISALAILSGLPTSNSLLPV